MSKTGLTWCHGCQANVKPTLKNECPRCGTVLKSTIPKIPLEAEREIEPEMESRLDMEVEEPLEIEFEEELDLFDRDRVQTPQSGRLVLNPKVDRKAKNPLCPECEEPIRRVEHDHAPHEMEDFTTVEFVCGCDQLQYFGFEEIGSPE